MRRRAAASSSSGGSSSSSPSPTSEPSASTQPIANSTDQICAVRGAEISCVPVLPTNVEPEELRMWQLVNQDRTSASCVDETKGNARPLQWDERLAIVARAHSQEMASRGFFGHEGMDGSLPHVRISRIGVQWRESAENIAKYPDITAAEAAFMNEPKFQPNHRANILNPALHACGHRNCKRARRNVLHHSGIRAVPLNHARRSSWQVQTYCHSHRFWINGPIGIARAER